MKPIRVLGIDPGSSHVGWAVLDVNGKLVSWVDGGSLRPDEISPGWFVTRLCDMVGIEMPEPRSPKALRDIVRAMRVAGRIEGWAQALTGSPIKTFSAYEWRKAIVGNSNASDSTIAMVIRGRVALLPKQTNNHVRDACGVAIYAAGLT